MALSKKTLRAVTPVGTFTRTTETGYKFVTVWASPRAKAHADAVAAGGAKSHGGVMTRWVKDQGFGVTWHFKRPAPRSFVWDSAATLVGVFEVEDFGAWEPEADDAWKEADDKLLAAHRARKAAK